MIFAAYTAPNGTSTAYTVVSRTATLTHGVLCNTSGAPVTVSVGVIRETDGAAAQLIDGFSLPAAESLSLSHYLAGAVLRIGDAITVTTSAGNAVDIVISGDA